MLDPSLGFSRRGAEAQWKKMAGDRSQESAESFAPRLRSRIDCLSLIRPAGRTPSGLSLRSSLCRSAPLIRPAGRPPSGLSLRSSLCRSAPFNIQNSSFIIGRRSRPSAPPRLCARPHFILHLAAQPPPLRLGVLA